MISSLEFQKELNDVPPEKCDVQLADQVVAGVLAQATAADDFADDAKKK